MLALISSHSRVRAPPPAAIIRSSRVPAASMIRRLHAAAKATPSITARCRCPAPCPLVRPMNCARALVRAPSRSPFRYGRNSSMPIPAGADPASDTMRPYSYAFSWNARLVM